MNATSLNTLAAPTLRNLLAPPQRFAATHRPCVLWFTGLSGAGKSTLAGLLKTELDAMGCHTAQLDGDVLREGLCKGLGFSAEDRIENIRRVAHVASLMAQSQLIVLVTLVSPYRASRDLARSLVPKGDFLEVFVDAPLPVVMRRDTKGLYARARRGEDIQLTGVQSPYEPPTSPELRIDSSACDPQEACEQLLALLVSHGVVARHGALQG